MPCRSYDDGDYAAAEADCATQAACELVQVFRTHAKAWAKAQNKLTRKTLKWIEGHDEQDRKREAEEKAEQNRKALRRTALKKLTPAERAAL